MIDYFWLTENQQWNIVSIWFEGMSLPFLADSEQCEGDEIKLPSLLQAERVRERRSQENKGSIVELALERKEGICCNTWLLYNGSCISLLMRKQEHDGYVW